MTVAKQEAARARRSAIDRYAKAHPQLTLHAQVSPQLESALDRVGCGVVLDVGCGEGATTRVLSARNSLATLIGCDLSQYRARVAGADGSPVVVGDAERLPIATASCDLVVCRHVIEHVGAAALLAEIARVMRPGALVYIETPLRLRFAWYPYRNANGGWVLDPTHVWECTSVADVHCAMRVAGLEPLESETVPIRYPVRHLGRRVLNLARRRDRTGVKWSNDRWSIRVPRYRELRLLARGETLDSETERTRSLEGVNA